jgi:DNA-directed RNA polymerase subunit beta
VVKDGVVTNEIVYVTADEEERAYIAPAKTPVDENGRIIPDTVQVRYMNGFPVVKREQVTRMDRSPLQIFSAAANLIPFLENDDANRALMGSNMQRQAVPLLLPQRPIVGTGIEEKVARDSGAVIIARREGTVVRSTAEEIQVRTRSGEADRYRLDSMLRSNQDTSITQRPIVRKGERVRAGDVLADGPCTDQGRLALGQNILAAFMTWEGYNYEDAIILSQRIVKDDVFTSVHIRKYEAEARDTKLGPEEITRDIPNVGEDALKDLDENGVIRIGAEVQADDILVGRIAPKSQGEQSAEERLIIAIFGKKAEEASDQSLRVPHGGKGIIVDVKVFSRFKYSCSNCKHEYNYSKKPERLSCERCGGDLVREPGDELSPGVNQLVRVYVAEKRTIMEGDKMAGRHGNKGVVSRILPVEEMPFMPDGTPVDVILNPLGVPGRMNIGQVLETHLGLVGKALGLEFTEPIFYGAKEDHVLNELDKLVEHYRRRHVSAYIQDELGIDLQPYAGEDEEGFPRQILDLSSDEMLDALEKSADGWDQEKRDALGERLGLGILFPVAPEIFTPANGTAATVRLVPDQEAEPVFEPTTARMIRDQVDRNVDQRIGLERRFSIANNREERTGKCWLYSSQTGEKFDHPVTIGAMYMLKLLHLVEDKIHARSTGPYALVTQQPLGGKAQFGGQRFGEMEVWALEAYGAAYTLQEILTIKSDDVTGRVKTYESIVKGDQIQEPGVPESFRILVAELQNLGLKVTVQDETDNEIDLRLREDETVEEPSRFLTRRFGALEEE